MRAVACAIISFVFGYISFNTNGREINTKVYMLFLAFIFLAISVVLMFLGK